MTFTIEHFKQSLSNLDKKWVDSSLAELQPAQEKLLQALQKRCQDYTSLTTVQEWCEAQTDPSLQLTGLLTSFPMIGLYAVAELHASFQPEAARSLATLLIALHLDKKDTLQSDRAEILQNGVSSAAEDDLKKLPDMFRQDFKHFGAHWQTLHASEDLTENFEVFFLLEGTSQGLWQIYADLLILSENEKTASSFYEVFSQFFVAFQKYRAESWSSAGIPHVVEKELRENLEESSHTTFNSSTFQQLQSLSAFTNLPVLLKNDETAAAAQQQLDQALTLPLHQLGLLFKLLQQTHGGSAVMPMLMVLGRQEVALLQELQQFFQESATSLIEQELQQLTGDAISRIALKGKRPASIGSAQQINTGTKKQKTINAGNAQEYLKQRQEKKLPKRQLNQTERKECLQKLQQSSNALKSDSPISASQVQQFADSIKETLNDVMRPQSLSDEERADYQEFVTEELQNLEKLPPQERQAKLKMVETMLGEAKAMSQRKQAAQNYEDVLEKAFATNLKINDEHTVTVEKLTQTAISRRHKIQLLRSYVPDTLTEPMMNALVESLFRGARDPIPPILIYDRDGNLSEGALLEALFPSSSIGQLLEKKIVPILPEKGDVLVTIRDFFSFPLGTGKDGEDGWCQQHLQYLKMACDKNKFDTETYQKLESHQSQLTEVTYKKYFNVFPGKHFQEDLFMVAYGLWQNNGLLQLRKK